MIAHNHRVAGAVRPASAAQHSAPRALHRPMDSLQCPAVPGNAVVCIVAAKRLVEVLNLLRDRLVPHPPHLVLQARKRSSQSCLLRTQSYSKVAFLISGAVQGEAQAGLTGAREQKR
jgi:hypothetical protein